MQYVNLKKASAISIIAFVVTLFVLMMTAVYSFLFGSGCSTAKAQRESYAHVALAGVQPRLLPAQYGETATDELTASGAFLKAIYPDAFDPLFPRKAVPPNPDSMVYCLRVLDGDSYRIRYTITKPDTFDTMENIRLVGVDCDEILGVSVPQPFGQIEADSISGWLTGAYMVLRVLGRDGNGQTIGQLFLDGKDVGLSLLKLGWAQYTPTDLLSKDTRRAYEKARNRAKKNRLGRWSNDKVIDPAQWKALLKK